MQICNILTTALHSNSPIGCFIQRDIHHAFIPLSSRSTNLCRWNFVGINARIRIQFLGALLVVPLSCCNQHQHKGKNGSNDGTNQGNPPRYTARLGLGCARGIEFLRELSEILEFHNVWGGFHPLVHVVLPCSQESRFEHGLHVVFFRHVFKRHASLYNSARIGICVCCKTSFTRVNLVLGQGIDRDNRYHHLQHATTVRAVASILHHGIGHGLI
mmetsp:Transcript_9388/g.14577  ORF Transcript_9388/g.14577 Transcript_9388/m.14577 type:complete len:215 (+) Transcript_9388:106-750(+)